jgi:hypothetical protein
VGILSYSGRFAKKKIMKTHPEQPDPSDFSRRQPDALLAVPSVSAPAPALEHR